MNKLNRMEPQKSTTTTEPTLIEQSTQQPEQMTPELAAELVQLLKDPKIQVKYASLNAILQYTKSEQAKLLFLNTELFKLVVENMVHQQIHKLCLSTLIHFSSSEACAEKLVDYVQPIIMDLRNAEGLVEELGLLFLLNVSKQYEFTQRLLKQNGPTELSSVLLQILFSFMETKPARRWVIANIFVNLSSHDVGRQYIAKQRLFITFLKYINQQKQSLRLAVLRIIRNISFLWQQEQIITQLLKKDHHLIDHMAIHILIMIIKSHLCEKCEDGVKILRETGYNNILDYDMEIEPELDRIKTTKEKSINQIQICVDVIIILSNAQFPKRKPEFCMQELKQVIALANFTPISEEAKDKLEALETFCFW